MSKLRAFLIHFSISATVVGIVFAVIFFVWYPDPYFRIAGTGEVVRVLIGVDLVLGPLLTLILFKSGKPRLLFDLTVIALIQLSALIYGANVIFQERPYFVVFAIDRLVVVPKKDVDLSKIEYEELLDKPWRAPIFAFASLPDSNKEREKLMMEVIAGGPDIERRPEYWSPFAERIDQVMARAEALTRISPQDDEARKKFGELIQRHENADQLVFLPVISRLNVYSMVFDPATKALVDILAIDPWEHSGTVGNDPQTG